MAEFNPEHKAVLDGLILGHSNIRAGKMFGSPAYSAGKKLCICLYEQAAGAVRRQASGNGSKCRPVPASGEAEDARMGSDQPEALG